VTQGFMPKARRGCACGDQPDGKQRCSCSRAGSTAEAGVLPVSQPTDACEVQAEAAAAAIANGHSVHVGRASGSADSLAASTGLTGAGQPLSEGTKRKMEPAFGCSFGGKHSAES
jgi:hypothetical protein